MADFCFFSMTVFLSCNAQKNQYNENCWMRKRSKDCLLHPPFGGFIAQANFAWALFLPIWIWC